MDQASSHNIQQLIAELGSNIGMYSLIQSKVGLSVIELPSHNPTLIMKSRPTSKPILSRTRFDDLADKENNATQPISIQSDSRVRNHPPIVVVHSPLSM